MSTTTIDPRDRAFERLYRRYARDVYRFVLTVVRNPQEAEDVTQTAFLNAYRAYQRGDRPERPHSWLIAIAHNAIRSRNRWTLRRPKEVAFDEALLELSMPAAERSDVAAVLQALGELPVNQREALAMRELEGRSYPEIAETLGVTVPAVQSLIHRARKTLRAQRTSLQGLAVVQLPRSLRVWLERDPSGAGLTAKTAAVAAAATVVAGGIGVGSEIGGATQPGHRAPTSLEARGVDRVGPSTAFIAVVPHRTRAHATIRRHASRRRPVDAPAPSSVAPPPAVEPAPLPAPVPDPPAPDPPAGATADPVAPDSAAPESSAPPPSPTPTTTAVAASVPVPVPGVTVPDLPVALPPVPGPPVTVPQLPDPPLPGLGR